MISAIQTHLSAQSLANLGPRNFRDCPAIDLRGASLDYGSPRLIEWRGRLLGGKQRLDELEAFLTGQSEGGLKDLLGRLQHDTLQKRRTLLQYRNPPRHTTAAIINNV
jgi:hypothetical protein